ncbi:hypothetical protein FA592_03575 [Sulfurospirillum diekertiae]|uniref:Uncharacterized protein n=1 Tax=Sulfurospirillum diekertiae TaxID=1854492 RepID=A0A6G9VSK3_9BACT|nr:hypothetical protein [Sulfurospirillum diekertiae]QIR75355.1 hypothetical protein FA584_03670 [Sulfurospirillum diekertiae]QIR78004.1 hypothetical protein FA592_03575 [Sulfurospirillum diekertiae]
MLPLPRIDKIILGVLVALILMFLLMFKMVEIDFASFTLSGISLSILGLLGILAEGFYTRYKESKIIPIKTYFDDEIIEIKDEEPKATINEDVKSEMKGKFDLKFGGN